MIGGGGGGGGRPPPSALRPPTSYIRERGRYQRRRRTGLTAAIVGRLFILAECSWHLWRARSPPTRRRRTRSMSPAVTAASSRWSGTNHRKRRPAVITALAMPFTSRFAEASVDSLVRRNQVRDGRKRRHTAVGTLSCCAVRDQIWVWMIHESSGHLSVVERPRTLTIVRGRPWDGRKVLARRRLPAKTAYSFGRGPSLGGERRSAQRRVLGVAGRRRNVRRFLFKQWLIG